MGCQRKLQSVISLNNNYNIRKIIMTEATFYRQSAPGNPTCTVEASYHNREIERKASRKK